MKIPNDEENAERIFTSLRNLILNFSSFNLSYHGVILPKIDFFLILHLRMMSSILSFILLKKVFKADSAAIINQILDHVWANGMGKRLIVPG